jgi:hypothetical protein
LTSPWAVIVVLVVQPGLQGESVFFNKVSISSL